MNPLFLATGTSEPFLSLIANLFELLKESLQRTVSILLVINNLIKLIHIP